ncbi:DUF1877 family protein [Sphingopyxis sp. KK2]|uniref:DUF1877 family protein n=1 Tax=Sphingopyxis sp. KK2 TaxID=1855727 RepID=UPI00097E6E59|nr:DUF1877 family protein [Sphingopyxis sp. KK2]
MAWRGVHFAVDDTTLSGLLCTPAAARADYVANEIEENWESNFATETDKAWPLIHASLQGSNPEADGLERLYDKPVSWAVLGREFLDSDPNYLIALIQSRDVAAVASLLKSVSADDIIDRLGAAIDHFGCKNVGAAEARYAGEWFPNLEQFFQRAAEAKRHVIFTVDF